MKITPLDIQQQQFRVKFRGFDMVEVDNFLDAVANEWEELLRENNRLKEEDRQKTEKIEETQRGGKGIEECSGFGQQICEEIKKQCPKGRDLIIEEARGNARRIIEAAQTQAIQLQTEISRLSRQREEFKASLKIHGGNASRLLESVREGPSIPGP